MADFVETLIDSDDIDALQDFLAGLPDSAQFIGPVKGVPGYTEPATDEFGTVNPDPKTHPAKGDPNRWYVNILTDSVIEVPAGFNLTDEETSRSIVGVWA